MAGFPGGCSNSQGIGKLRKSNLGDPPPHHTPCCHTHFVSPGFPWLSCARCQATPGYIDMHSRGSWGCRLPLECSSRSVSTGATLLSTTLTLHTAHNTSCTRAICSSLFASSAFSLLLKVDSWFWFSSRGHWVQAEILSYEVRWEESSLGGKTMWQWRGRKRVSLGC